MSIVHTKTQVINEGKDIPQSLWPFVWLVMRRHPWCLGMFVFFVFFDASIPAATSYLLKLMIDGVINVGSQLDLLIPTILIPALLYVGIQLSMNIIYSIYRYAHLIFYPKIKSDISGTMHHYLTQHSYRYFTDHFAGSLSKKIFDLLHGVESIIQISTHILLPRTLSALFASMVLYWVQPLFGLILFAWSFVYVSISYVLSKRSEEMSYQTSQHANIISGKMVDSITNIMSTKLFTNSQQAEKVVFDSIDNMMRVDRKMLWYLLNVNIVQGIMVMSLVIFMLIALIYGRLNNFVTVGDFALVLTLSSEVATRIYSIGESILQFSRDIGNSRQALDTIVQPHEITDLPDAKNLEVTQGEIVFDNVQFQYQGADALFNNKTVKIPAGQKVGLVGHSGSGKSTFVNLILRLFDVTSGSIRIDGMDIKQVTQDSLRKNIGMIPQDPSLFHQTLMQNIHYGRLDATIDEVIVAAKRAHAHEFIENLPQGYESLVGERGVKLSGGQRQRVAIARAFLKNAPILVFDEATSQLDSVTEQFIQESIHELMQGKTTIVIAHRLSTLLNMDRILVFDKGKIVEDGTHEELLAQGGMYATLWKAQVGGFLID